MKDGVNKSEVMKELRDLTEDHENRYGCNFVEHPFQGEYDIETLSILTDIGKKKYMLWLDIMRECNE